MPGLLPCFSDFDFDFSSDFGLFRVVSSLWLARFVVAHDLFFDKESIHFIGGAIRWSVLC